MTKKKSKKHKNIEKKKKKKNRKCIVYRSLQVSSARIRIQRSVTATMKSRKKEKRINP